MMSIPRNIVAGCLTAAVCLIAGCVQTNHYELAVRNDTRFPVTIWLTKNGPPDEPAWRSPEQVVIERGITHGDPISGVVIEPGKTANTKITGQFANDSRAILRVYRGKLRMTEILAVSHDSPDRLDIWLPPGPSKLVITDTDVGRLVIRPVKAFGPPASNGSGGG
jgi:hypothetical protein